MKNLFFLVYVATVDSGPKYCICLNSHVSKHVSSLNKSLLTQVSSVENFTSVVTDCNLNIRVCDLG